MKSLLLLVSVLLAAPAAFANIDVDNTNDQVMDLEMGPMSQDAADELTPPMQLNGFRSGEVAGEFLEIIGAVAADRIGDGRRGPGRERERDRDRDRDRRRDRDRDRGDWNRGRDFVCYARDFRGRVYRAVGQNPRRVQDRAMQNCLRNARICVTRGCQRI